MFTKKEILEVAKMQLSKNYQCKVSDFDKLNNVWIKANDGSTFFKLLIFQGQAIILADDKLKSWIEKELLQKDASWLFDYHILKTIDQKLNEFDYEIKDILNYYLPYPSNEEVKPIRPIKWFEKDDITQFKGDQRFDEAFIFDEDAPDMLGVAAFDKNQIIAMAGASKDYEVLHQVGINVDSNYENQGLGTNLIALLKQELLKRGKIPFYRTAISHISSRNLCLKAGFFPAWVEIESKKK